MPVEAVTTANPTLDAALGGGLRQGSVVLVEGEDGAGGLEFVATLLRAAALDGVGRRVSFLSPLRSEEDVRRELGSLFPDDKAVASIEIIRLFQSQDAEGPPRIGPLHRGDILAIESPISLTHAGISCADMSIAIRDAARPGAIVLVLHARGTLSSVDEAMLREGSDVTLEFRWRENSTSMRRMLAIRKVRGLAPVMEGSQVPLFEVRLERGLAYMVSRIESVV